MAAITFHINNFSAASTADPTLISHGAGSGLGFYGGGFGISVPVAQYQDTTFVTNSNGTTSGIKGQNTKYVSVSGLSHNSSETTLGNSGVPNYYAPLRISFTHNEEVAVQNCKLRIFDRNDISKQASGVTTQVYEVRHPHPSEGQGADHGPLNHRGIAHHGWYEYLGNKDVAMTDMTLTSSPGLSGLNTAVGETVSSGDGVYYNWLTNDGPAHSGLQHDWYLALSASPDGIGSKTDYALYMTLEYL